MDAAELYFASYGHGLPVSVIAWHTICAAKRCSTQVPRRRAGGAKTHARSGREGDCTFVGVEAGFFCGVVVLYGSWMAIFRSGLRDDVAARAGLRDSSALLSK